MTDTVQKEFKSISLKKAFIWSGFLIVLDAFFLNQGIISALFGVWFLLVSLPRAAFTKIPEQRNLHLKRAVIFLGAVMLIFGLNWANNQIARQRADTLIAAIQSFNLQNNRYPDNLDELVPKFINHVPEAKYTFLFQKFTYVSSPNSHRLFYISIPPFGRPTYIFESGSWGHLD